MQWMTVASSILYGCHIVLTFTNVGIRLSVVLKLWSFPPARVVPAEIDSDLCVPSCACWSKNSDSKQERAVLRSNIMKLCSGVRYTVWDLATTQTWISCASYLCLTLASPAQFTRLLTPLNSWRSFTEPSLHLYLPTSPSNIYLDRYNKNLYFNWSSLRVALGI